MPVEDGEWEDEDSPQNPPLEQLMMEDPQPDPPEEPSVKQEPIPEFDPRVRQDFEGLLYLGRLIDSFHWAGHHFVIKTLGVGEILEIGLLHKPYVGTLGDVKAYQALVVSACTEQSTGGPCRSRSRTRSPTPSCSTASSTSNDPGSPRPSMPSTSGTSSWRIGSRRSSRRWGKRKAGRNRPLPRTTSPSSRPQGTADGIHLSPVQDYAVELLLISEERNKVQDFVDQFRLTMIGHDPGTWIPEMFPEWGQGRTEEVIVTDLEDFDFSDTRGEWVFTEDVTPEEAEAIMAEMLSNPVGSFTMDRPTRRRRGVGLMASRGGSTFRNIRGDQVELGPPQPLDVNIVGGTPDPR